MIQYRFRCDVCGRADLRKSKPKPGAFHWGNGKNFGWGKCFEKPVIERRAVSEWEIV